MATRPSTIRDLIPKTAGYLAGKGVPSPRLDAELLLAYTLELKRLDLYLQYDRPLSAAELDRLRELVRRRGRREPLQYITGRQGFWKLELQISPAVLIPRPETELLAEEALRAARNFPRPRILDLGTGSGALALALAAELPEARIVATDICAHALAVACANAAHLGLDDRVSFVRMDGLEALRSEGPDWELIVSNPPYIPRDEFSQLMPEVRDFEPRLALDGGAQGLDLLARIIRAAPLNLVPGGHLLLEIGYNQGSPVAALLEAAGAFAAPRQIKDYQGHPRVIHARKNQ